ncbi:DNA mismatch repair endonuclease MutL [Acholeplasma vituli]|uniref:DNA mismatch repair protein MutL n=1 Tax=Paracholeplasma vituli TaxID=69473 RepID=A0ABT2PY56_9MOLU|nr:DNA mismatch repair endonuclease MutL [Paracholeplasma vituli]MCU0105406.1 DNA mismatch repair endonuclease MutL [Paracholeplasma vituli]
MAKIIKLDERLSNMIAAGEVVTRPASALKELIENAIDAKATKIEIHLKNHGLDEIKVVDNGIGMEATDLHLAFLRHATSKIKNEYDLAHIVSLGFRGEAVPAIASVSKMTISSKTLETDPYTVTYEGGVLVHEGRIALNQGTEVKVRDLFYNVPARLKYIKSPQTELAYMLEVIDEMMLANPKIAFVVSHDQKVLRTTSGSADYLEIFANIYGNDIAKSLKIHDIEQNDIRIKAYLVSPQITRARKNDVIVSVNGRTIQNYVLVNSVVEGYHTHLMVGRYPIAYIDIHLDVSLVDVNVHPQKKEIKFSNEYVVANLIRTCVGDAFKVHNESIPDSLKTPSPTVKYTGFELWESGDNVEVIKPNRIEETPLEIKTEQPKPKLPEMSYIGAYAGTYLLFQNPQGLYLVDQHAAAERIRYEIIFERLGDHKTERKQLLTPILYHFRPTEQDIVEHNRMLLASYGLDFEVIQDAYALRELPLWLDEKDIDYMVYSLLEQLRTYQSIDIKKLRDQLAKDVACKGAIKANKALNTHEIEHLMEALKACDNPYYCPHGRPIVISFTQYEIEKLFKRIV